MSARAAPQAPPSVLAAGEPDVPEKIGKNFRGLRTSFSAPWSHVFVAKLSYWFTP